MQGDIKPSRCETTICERCTEEHNRLFEGSNNHRQHKDLFYYILYFSYCLLHLQNSERLRILLYVTTFYMQLCAVACFVLKQ